MGRASAVACAAIIGFGGLLASQALAQMVRHVDGQGPRRSFRPSPETRPSSPPCPSRLSKEQWLLGRPRSSPRWRTKPGTCSDAGSRRPGSDSATRSGNNTIRPRPSTASCRSQHRRGLMLAGHPGLRALGPLQ